MNKYMDNFDENEYNKYASKFLVLNKVLAFMIEEHIGEYLEKNQEV